MLRDAMLAAPAHADDKYAQERMQEMHELIELATGWFNDIHRLSPETLENLMRLGSKVQKVLGFADRLRGGDQPDKPDAA